MKVLSVLVRSLCGFLLGAIYVVAAIGKLHQPKAFLRAVADYEIVPSVFIPWVAATLPAIELLAGLLLVGGAIVVWRRRGGWLDNYSLAAAWIAAGLLVIFTVVLTINLLRGIKMDCGCFDLLGNYVPFLKESEASWRTVVRDLVMLAFAYPVIRWRK